MADPLSPPHGEAAARARRGALCPVPPPAAPRLEDLARDALDELYTALAGSPPRSLRGYRDGDDMMLVLRFTPLPDCGDAEPETMLDVSLIALLELVADIVGVRSGRPVAPANVSVCACSGLAVFAFRVLAQGQRDGRDDHGGGRRGASPLDGGLRLAG